MSERSVSERSEIARLLRHEVFRAKSAFEHATRAFHAVTDNLPSGIPHPDGPKRIANAGETFRFMMNAYADALSDFIGFIATGTIPDRQKDDKNTKINLS